MDHQNFFDQTVKNDVNKYQNVRKIDSVQGGDYTTGCLLNNPYFKENYNLIPRNLSKLFYGKSRTSCE